MERDFYNDEFEELVKQKADQYKLYPSDKVWKRIYSALHTGKRWYITGMSLLIIAIFFIAGKELLVPDTHDMAASKQADPGLKNIGTEAEKNDVSKLPIAPDFLALNAVPGSQGTKTDNRVSVVGIQGLQDIFRQINPVDPNTATINQDPATAHTEENVIAETIPAKLNPAFTPGDHSLVIENFPLADKTRLVLIPANAAQPELTDDAVARQHAMTEEMNKNNWLQENASYVMPKSVRKSRFQLEEYLSPTASYRTLSGGGSYDIPKSTVQNIPIALTHLGSPNDYVDHKPAAGFEVGANIVYRLTRNVAIETGLQFNYSHYTIEAYSSYNPQPATITLNSIYGFSPNSITRYTNVQNFGGNSAETLQNQYFQLSAPIGLEVKVLGNERLQLNVAATIQPTYLLNRTSYLLATDYSNYIKDTTLFRRWNFDAGLEAFVSYKLGKMRLQLGPQFRYQLLSTFVGAYPIKENLKEYGIKIGISKSIW
jgi:hypothetical protein